MKINVSFGALIVSSACYSLVEGSSTQHVFLSNSALGDALTPSRHNAYIGMDLATSFGAVVVSYINGTSIDVAKLDGDKTYLEMMHRLSLDSSIHLTPPYNDYEEMIRDRPRQMKRRIRKSRGLPASEDVAVIAKMMTALKDAAKEYSEINITSALVATPNLPALYREDIEDAFAYLALESLDGSNPLLPLFREPSGIEASFGVGLCPNPLEHETCVNETVAMPAADIVTIVYNRNCLLVELSIMASAYYYSPYPTTPTSMDCALGSDAVHENPDSKYYWDAVRERLLRGLGVVFPGRKAQKVFISGESADTELFRQHVKDAATELYGKEWNVEYLHDQSMGFAAARGAAEFARRGGWAHI